MTIDRGDGRFRSEWKIDAHTHILPQDWPLMEGIDLQLKPLSQQEFAQSRNTGGGNLNGNGVSFNDFI
jgi:hypothetical protein